MRRLTPVLALGALLLTALPAHAADGPAHRESYGTKAPYAPQQTPRTYQLPPSGFEPVFAENVSRHGFVPRPTARTPTSSSRDITYKMAGVLLDDLFKQVEAKRAGNGDLGAELRFTHAEEIIPLAALMGLPGSTEPATPGEPYTYADNPWRGASVAPLGASIQWDVFKKGDRYLVRMLYNEKETPFKAGCRPIAKRSTFYDLAELERCFGRS
ncbi:histidine-type phosphatase [Streptomyces sp. NPDC046931]|uniref:histidine-type phosphatase n=1 Tax=Streptomyces sp. NPDC046931 TaxID=3154806 RepID=UPI0033DE71B1